MSTLYAKIRIEREGRDVLLEVSGRYLPAERRTRDDPGCDASVDDVHAEDGTALTATEETFAAEALLEEGSARGEPDPDDARDRRRDEW